MAMPANQGRRARQAAARAFMLATCSLQWSTNSLADPFDLDAPIVTNPTRDGALGGESGTVDAPAMPFVDASYPDTLAGRSPPAVPAAAFWIEASDSPPGPGNPILQDISPGGPRVFTPLDTPLMLNGKFLGTISADVDLAGDGLIDSQRLLALLEPEISPTLHDDLVARIAGRDKVPFAALASDVFRLAFDTGALEMNAELSADGTASRSMRLSGGGTIPDPADYPAPARFSIGVNVSLAQRYLHDDDQWAPLVGAVDILAHVGGFEGVTFVGGFEYDAGDSDGVWSRQEFRLIKDFYGSAIRATAGEFTSIADGFQGGGRLAGFGVERAYSAIRPFQNIRPAGREDFTLERDATVDVIVNGLTVQTLRLTAGRYALSDFPFFNGANEVQLVSIDSITGRRELTTFDVFSGSDLLGRGMTEFGFAVGRDEGSEAFEYDGPLIATGYYRRGINDGVTVGTNAQASADARQVGGSVTWGSAWGLVLAQAALSQDDVRDRSGVAASVNYRKTFSFKTPDDVRFTASAQHLSRGFSDVFEPARRVTEAWRATALLQWQGPWEIGMNVGVGRSRVYDAIRDRRQLDFGFSRSFGRASAIANITVSDREDGGTETRVGLGLNLPLGGRWTSNARYESQRNRVEATLSRYARTTVGDISGEARIVNDDDARDISGRINYIGNRFEAEVVHNRRYDLIGGGQGSAESSIAIKTFVGYAGGRIGIGRPAGDGFIIAPVHRSLSESRVALTSGAEVVARSGWFGPPVLPIRRAYGVNGFTIGVEPLPTGYDLGSGGLSVFPPFGAGYVLPIGSDASRIAVGILVGSAGPVSLKPGLIERVPPDGKDPRPLFTNRVGRFVADALAPGRYRLTIDGASFEFVISEDSEGVVDVGTLQLGGL